MQKILNLTKFAIIFTSFIFVAFGASISGIVYDETIKTVDGAVLRLEKDAALYGQQVAKDGKYSFPALPEGNYRLIVTARINNKTLSTAARINLSAGDDLHIDFILMEELGATIPELIEIPEEEFPAPIEAVPINWALVGFLIGTVIVVLIIMLYLVKKIREKGKEVEKGKEEKGIERYLTDEERVYQIIQRRKEVPQKVIVAETGFSKAKVSAILKKLVQIGKIKRERIGREKLIKFLE